VTFLQYGSIEPDTHRLTDEILGLEIVTPSQDPQAHVREPTEFRGGIALFEQQIRPCPMGE
jgi:hypothetical protein